MSCSDRILYVDDEAMIRTAFQRTAAVSGYPIDVADGFEEAMTMAQSQPYAVIAVDYTMPVKNGLDVIRSMRDVQPDATYVLITGNVDLDATADEDRSKEIAYFLAKPWVPEELVGVLVKSVEEYRSRLRCH